MKLSDWARKQGVSHRTAYRGFRAGALPVPSKQLSTGTILVQEAERTAKGGVALYARVSGPAQKPDMERQMQRLRDYSAAQGLTIAKEVIEVGSGLNSHRKKLLALLSDQSISTVVVEHRDRLARFGSEYVEAALCSANRKLLVVNQSELKDDLAQDMIDVLTSFCARLYGRRAAKNRAKKAMEAISTP